ncbi:hypothetical protein [Methyloceanibacter sp.]|uniref:hypothetical protein n=1 Tax=Methyloceanibacter sp. TaxID=1965321 RepID=UPI002BC44E0A|nr:hypothetical protein [Methyloceanibacter sp.]HML93097.1 hypothetical protein [Methyloceanibacter sp.]
MFGLLKVRRARKVAVALISPFVEESQTRFSSQLTEHAWLDPYMVGFMSMLISLAAEYTAGRLDSESAGLVQLEAWQEVTGFPSHLIGEEICLLSSGQDRKFRHGCLNASRFMEELTRPVHSHPDQLPPGYRTHGLNYDRSAAMALWSELFDGHIGALDGDLGLPR